MTPTNTVGLQAFSLTFQQYKVIALGGLLRAFLYLSSVFPPHPVPGMVSHEPSTQVIAGVMETAVAIKNSIDAEGSFNFD